LRVGLAFDASDIYPVVFEDATGDIAILAKVIRANRNLSSKQNEALH
jgi:hypothetical protein